MKIEEMSCIDCMVKNCSHEDKEFPAFCPTTNMDPEILGQAMACYEEDENRKVMVAPADPCGGDYVLRREDRRKENRDCYLCRALEGEPHAGGHLPEKGL